MAMDSAKKATVEKSIVLGLLVVFGVALSGSLKQMGFLKFSMPHTQPLLPQPVTISKPLAQTVQEQWQKQIPASETAPSNRPSVAAGQPAPALYTAHELRDPLKSLLPEEPKGQEIPVTRTDAPVVSRSAPRPLPPLTIQGLWWGDAKPKAIINGHVYGVGDRVDGAVITDIGRHGVTVDYQGVTTRVGPSTNAAPGALSRSARRR